VLAPPEDGKITYMPQTDPLLVHGDRHPRHRRASLGAVTAEFDDRNPLGQGGISSCKPACQLLGSRIATRSLGSNLRARSRAATTAARRSICVWSIRWGPWTSASRSLLCGYFQQHLGEGAGCYHESPGVVRAMSCSGLSPSRSTSVSMRSYGPKLVACVRAWGFVGSL
jgi:hypothetical protein